MITVHCQGNTDVCVLMFMAIHSIGVEMFQSQKMVDRQATSKAKNSFAAELYYPVNRLATTQVKPLEDF